MSRLWHRYLLMLMVLPFPALWAEWKVGGQSLAVLEGDSTVKAWQAETQTVHADVSLPWDNDDVERFLEWVKQSGEGSAKEMQKRLKQAPPKVKAELKIKIEDLDSDNDRMERDMQEALKSKEHPWIIYNLTSIRAVSLSGRDGKKGAVIHTTGTLSLSGTSKDVELEFTLSPAEKEGVLLVSTKSFRMTDFGITPPRALFGLIKAHDEVNIQYRIHLIHASAKE